MTPTELGQIISTQKGYAFKSKWYSDAGTPIVKVSNLTDDSVDTSKLTYIPKDIAKNYKKFCLRTDDIVIQTVGSWPSNPASVVGKVIRIPSSASGTLLNQNAVRIDPDDRVTKKFLFYLLKDNRFRDYIVGCAQGAASQASITLDAIRGFRFDLPPLPVQRKIAAVLSAYDDLIENNTRRIKILEEMAQAIYRKWFVEYKFPGHEDVPLVDSGTELGEIPRGWKVRNLGDECTLVIGQSPKSEFYNQDGNGLPFHQGVKDFSERFPNHNVYCTLEKRIAEAGDILFSVRAPVGRINVADTKLIIGRGLHAIRHNSGHQWFLFHQLKEMFYQEDMIGGGTIFKSVTKDDMLNIKLIVPSSEIEEKFEQLLRPVSAQIANLTKKNSNLRATRDLLLPRLVSGDVEV